MNIIELFGTTIKPKIVKGKYMFAPLETGKICEGVFAIRDKDVNLFIYKKGDHTIAIDSGYKNSLNVSQGFSKLNIDPSCISEIFLTHVDLDHAGGVDNRCNNIFTNAQIYLSKEEAKYLTGEYARKNILFIRCKTPINLSKGYKTLEDKEIVNIDDIKLQFLLVPGHTLGHGCYLVDNKYLFLGDCIILVNGLGYSFYDLWNFDSKLNISSLKKLKTASEIKDVKMIFTSHSGMTSILDEVFANIESVPDWKGKGFSISKSAPYDPFV